MGKLNIKLYQKEKNKLRVIILVLVNYSLFTNSFNKTYVKYLLCAQNCSKYLEGDKNK